jgi:hypothetical protein
VPLLEKSEQQFVGSDDVEFEEQGKAIQGDNLLRQNWESAR